MGDIISIDGRIVEDGRLPATDLGLIRGYGVFDFTRTYRGKAFKLVEHVERLYESAASIGIHMPWPVAHVVEQVETTLAHSDYAESYIRVVVTGGDSDDAILPSGHPRVIVIVSQAAPPSAAEYNAGAAMITVNEPRYLAGVKTTNYAPAVRAVAQAREAGASDAYYIDDDGYVLEGTTHNLFIVKDGAIITPPLDRVLRGITRAVVMQLAAEEGYNVTEAPVHRDQLYAADEAFSTSSTKQVMPVVQVDGHSIGDGKPGPHTRRIMAAFEALTGVRLGEA